MARQFKSPAGMALGKKDPERMAARIMESQMVVDAAGLRARLEAAMTLLVEDVQQLVQERDIDGAQDALDAFKANLQPWLDMVLGE